MPASYSVGWAFSARGRTAANWSRGPTGPPFGRGLAASGRPCRPERPEDRRQAVEQLLAGDSTLTAMWLYSGVGRPGCPPRGLLVRWYAWLLQMPRIRCFTSNPLSANSLASASSSSGWRRLVLVAHVVHRVDEPAAEELGPECG